MRGDSDDRRGWEPLRGVIFFASPSYTSNIVKGAQWAEKPKKVFFPCILGFVGRIPLNHTRKTPETKILDFSGGLADDFPNLVIFGQKSLLGA